MADVFTEPSAIDTPRFLTLRPDEAELLATYGPRLAQHSHSLADRFYAWLYRECELAAHLQRYDMVALSQQQAQHYRQLLLEDFNAERRDNLHRIGQRHQEIGIPLQWISAAYTLYSEHLENDLSTLDLPPEEAMRLGSALRKRVQLDSFWHQEGVQAAEQQAIATREAFYHAVTEANRLFIGLSGADGAAVEKALAPLADVLAREMVSPLVWIGLTAPGEVRVDIAAAAGEAVPITTKAVVSIDPNVPEGNGPTGLAIRSGSPQIVPDASHDPRLTPWRGLTTDYGLGGQAVAPFQLKNGCRGVIALYCRTGESFPADLADLLVRLAEDLAAFLDRRDEAREILRMRRYKATLDAMQFQLLQAPRPEVVYGLLVDLLLKHTDTPRVMVAVREGDSNWLRVAAAAARDEATTTQLRRLKISTDPDEYPCGQLFVSRVYREGASIVLPNPWEDPVLQKAWRGDAVHDGIEAIAGWPIARAGEATPDAVLVVHGLSPSYFAPALCDLLKQLSANVSLALTQHAQRTRIEQLSFQDALTDLPNRTYFERTALDAMARAPRDSQRVAMGVLDLDRFKEWNDTLGHLCGDELLRKVAEAIRAVTRGGECVARLGGDEFGFHVVLSDDEELESLSNRLLEAIAGVEHEGGHVTASLGWAVYPDDATDFTTLLSHADAALYGAKDAGRNTFRLFSGEVSQEIQHRFAIRKTFPEAIKSGQIEFFLQPQVDFVAGKLDGVELLARWKSPDGWVSPARFIPAVERDRELIRLLGRHALREATKVRERLSLADLPLQIAVNIGAGHFLHPRFIEDVGECLGDTPAEKITIEITETVAIDDLPRAHQVLTELGNQGFRLSLDDFGTGYASLHHAASLPIDELKLDQHFIHRFRGNPRSLAVASAAVLLGEMSGRTIIAEGIETPDDCELWMRVGGRRIQGYLLTQPLPQSAFLEWTAHWSAELMRPVPPFPIEELPLLGQVFRDSSDGADLEGNARYHACSLTHWFEKRANRYGHLPAWRTAQTVHQRFHAIADDRDKHAPESLKKRRAKLRRLLKVLYSEIDATLVSVNAPQAH